MPLQPVDSIKWVGQDDEHGCVAACVAMMLGRRYDVAVHVLTHFADIPRWAFQSGGCAIEQVIPVLRAGRWHHTKADPEVWIVGVWSGEGSLRDNHAVIAFPGGDVFDPCVPRLRRLERYYYVKDAFGFRRQ